MLVCSKEEWLRALLSHDAELVIERFGLTRVSGRWELCDRVISEHYLTMVVDEINDGSVRGRALRMEPNSLLWIAPGVPHSLHPLSPQRSVRFFHLRMNLLQKGRDLRLRDDVTVLPNAVALRPAMEALFDEYSLALPFSGLRFRALLAAFFADVFRLQSTVTPGARSLTPSQRQRIMSLLQESANREISPAELAGELGYSSDYFTRIFRNTYGEPPRRWLVRQRMQRAAELMTQGTTTITDAAREAGYDDLFLFSRQFKKLMGLCPRDYRQKR